MLEEELRKQTDQLTEQTRLLLELVKRPESPALKVLAATGPIISGILIAMVGWYFTSTYNKQQMDLAQIELLEKLNAQLVSSNPDQRRAAFSALMSLENEDMAVRVAAAIPADSNNLLSELFLSAVSTVDFDLMKRILRIRKPIEIEPDEYGRTPLHLAIIRDEQDVLEFLIRQGFNPNTKTDKMEAPLVLAAQMGRTECVRVLLFNGAIPNLVDEKRMTALHHAVDIGCLPIVNMLARNKLVDINSRDDKYRSPLLVALRFRVYAPSYPAKEVVRLLLSHGADPNTDDKFGNSALLEAISNQHDEAFKLLFESGATLVSGTLRKNALHEAVWYGRNSIVQYLLAKGISPNSASDNHGSTPLHFVRDDFNVLQTLILAGADVNAVTKDGNTVLVSILNETRFEGMRVEERNSRGRKMIPIIEAVLNAKADPNKQSENGEYPLAVAACCQSLEVLEALVKAGARINDPSGWQQETPLIAAANSCRPENVDFLLKMGADRRIPDNESRTALNHAAETAKIRNENPDLIPSYGPIKNCIEVQRLLQR